MNGIREERLILRSLVTPGSAKFCALKTDTARLLYIGLLLNANDEGEVDGQPKLIARMLPWLFESNKTRRLYAISRAIDDLIRVNLVTRSSVGCLSIVAFQDNHTTEVSENTTPPEQEPRTELQKETPVLHSSFFMNKEEIKKEGMNEAGSGARGEGSNHADIFRRCKRRFRTITGRNFGPIGRLAGRWSVFVSRNSQEIVVRSVEMFADHVRDSEMDRRFPALPTFLNQSDHWAEEAENEAEDRIEQEKAQQSAPVEELIEWRGMKMTRKEVARLEREELESQKRKQERDRQKPWEPPTFDEGEKVQ